MMADQYGLINSEDGTWDGVVLDELPDPIPEGFYYIIVPNDYQLRRWDSVTRGWVDLTAPNILLTVGRFKLLLTREERIAIREAASTSPDVEDFLDLLNGFTDGISLSDPLLALALGEIQKVGLLSSDRVTSILAGDAPSPVS